MWEGELINLVFFSVLSVLLLGEGVLPPYKNERERHKHELSKYYFIHKNPIFKLCFFYFRKVCINLMFNVSFFVTLYLLKQHFKKEADSLGVMA